MHSGFFGKIVLIKVEVSALERVKQLGRYPKIILLILAVIILVFTILYPVITSRVGFLYEDTILVPSEADGVTVYSGNIRGTTARFTVSADKTVVFQYGDTVYGPYPRISNIL